jgi:dolichyl-phosphate beta-glucosyltransferase
VSDGPRPVLVVPCFDEAARLDGAAFLSLVAGGRLELSFVDDGSTDGTFALLSELASAAPGLVSVLRLAENQGKAEAVRRGLLEALGRGAPIVGYADADLSTPTSELSRLLQEVSTGSASVVLGSRVGLLGSRIDRSLPRHYLGRVFATAASSVLGIPVYDTQCGAKFFRATTALRAALAQPFASRWAFDVELLGRLLIGTPRAAPLEEEDFVEVPLREWRDVTGSKLGALGMARAGVDLMRIGHALSGYRAARRRAGR